ncbi:MAG: HAMP domain-containing sensor histidine kinase [Bacteroidales bacterium]|nr:HAMP domain-containing sensor histidine kinase [Bacteroidales bacterium]
MDTKKANNSKLSAVLAIFSLLLPFIVAASPISLAAVDDSTAIKLVTPNLNPDYLDTDEDIFLMISSFNPDTKRTMEFITGFEEEMQNKYKERFIILVEDMGVKSFTEEAHLWKRRVSRLLDKYRNRNLKGIITIGQEAWAALLSQEVLPKDIPVLGVFMSSNGIELPNSRMDSKWSPAWTNTIRKGLHKGLIGGGVFNVYLPQRNIELIISMFPKTNHIVLLTDNTYGGVSIRTLFNERIKNFPDLKCSFLDGRELSYSQIKDSIRNLPPNSVLLLATWRVSKDGQYFLNNSLDELVSANPQLPVFSMTGTGIGSVAIGGYIPRYSVSSKDIANQIVAFYNGNRDSVKFRGTGSTYLFDKKKLEQFSISGLSLPPKSQVIDAVDPRVTMYKRYLAWVSVITAVLSIFIIALVILNDRNKRLRKKLEENRSELITAKERAEESDRLKSAFLANMSHEIRTPLNAIVGFSNLLAEEEFSFEERREMSGVITGNSKLLLTLITDIMDFSGLETGKLNFLFKEVELNSFCEGLLSTANHIRKKGVEYRFEPAVLSLNIRTDAHRLSQVLLNLLTNANKFTEEGSVVLRYEYADTINGKRVKATTPGSFLLFSVTDTGTGIPVDQHNLLFERFGKLNSFKQGAGLGLAISKQIVTRLGGQIWIDPGYTKGARFCFTHPV